MDHATIAPPWPRSKALVFSTFRSAKAIIDGSSEAVHQPKRTTILAAPAPSRARIMNLRLFLVGVTGCLLGCLTVSRLGAADTPAAAPVNAATIFFSSAPWDGAAYDLEIPLQRVGDAAEPYLRISIWGFPEFPDPKTIHFTGKEDAGGGPSKGEGRALFQSILDKSMPESLAGTVTFKTLKKDSPVSGSYELATLDGKRVFRGSFQAAWGNRPPKVIR